MPNIVPGISLGDGVYIFRGSGDPNTITTQPLLYSCSVGSLFLRTDGSTSTSLYVCTVAGTPANSNGQAAIAGTWTGK